MIFEKSVSNITVSNESQGNNSDAAKKQINICPESNYVKLSVY